jgi:hypothetical protein
LGLQNLHNIYWDYKAPAVREALLNYDTQACRKILRMNESVLTKIINRIYGGGKAATTLPIIFKGLRQFVDVSPGCMEKFWGVGDTYSSWTQHSASRDSCWASFSSGHYQALLAST